VIVTDTDVIAYLILPGERTEASEAVLRKDIAWAAPVLWKSELRNVLASYVRTGRLALEDALALAERAEELLATREFTVPTRNVLRLATASGCAAYDCEFVVLARELEVPLITNDRAILEAFPDTAMTPERFAEN